MCFGVVIRIDMKYLPILMLAIIWYKTNGSRNYILTPQKTVSSIMLECSRKFDSRHNPWRFSGAHPLHTGSLEIQASKDGTDTL